MEATFDTSGIATRPSFWRKWRTFLLGRRRTTMANFTERLAHVYGDRTAFIVDKAIESDYFEGNVISHRDLHRMVCRAANVLTEMGVRRGDRVALATANRIELLFAEFGAQRIGAIPVPINFMLTADEIRELVERCGARVMVTDRTVFERNIRSRDAIPSVEQWLMVTRKEVPEGFASFDRMMAGADETSEAIDVADTDPAIIFYTAGTTGLPKGAVLTSGGLMYSFRRYAALAALRPTPNSALALTVMPLAHTGGHQQMLIMLALATPCLVMGSFSPSRILDYIEQYRVSQFSGIPSMFRLLVDAGAAERDLTSIRLWGGGGDAFSADLIAQFREFSERRTWLLRRRKRAAFVTGYGLAETAGQVSIAPSFVAGDSCVGWFLPGVKWRIADEHGASVPRGEVGELLVKTPGLMSGYWNDPEGTAEAIRGGWFHTGDLMRRGPWRMKYFVSREKEMIKVGGYSVFPAEIERSIEAHPAVERAVVVGMPHPAKGELPVAGVVLSDEDAITEDELTAWMEEHIAAYRCPRRVVFLDGIPQNFAMKPLRRAVRDDFIARGIAVQSRAERTPPQRMQA